MCSLYSIYIYVCGPLYSAKGVDDAVLNTKQSFFFCLIVLLTLKPARINEHVYTYVIGRLT